MSVALAPAMRGGAASFNGQPGSPLARLVPGASEFRQPEVLTFMISGAIVVMTAGP